MYMYIACLLLYYKQNYTKHNMWHVVIVSCKIIQNNCLDMYIACLLLSLVLYMWHVISHNYMINKTYNCSMRIKTNS